MHSHACIKSTHTNAHCTAQYISVMSLLCLYCLRYSRKLKSPLDPESTGLSATRAITQPESDASLAASVWFVAQQRGLIWEYWCRQGSLWPCCKQAAWCVTVPWGHVCDWEWRWNHSQQQISWQGRRNDLWDETLSQRIYSTHTCIWYLLLEGKLQRSGINIRTFRLISVTTTTMIHNYRLYSLPGEYRI